MANSPLEKNQVQNGLNGSDNPYRQLFEDAQEGIAITTPDGTILDANPAAHEILGYSREELRGMKATDLYVNPSERDLLINDLKEKGAIAGRDVWLRRKNSEEILCRLSSTARRGPSGEVKTLHTFLRDITNKKQAQEELRRSERRYRRLFESSQEGITITTPGGEIIDANPALCQLTGYEREELIGRQASTLYDDDTREMLVQELQEKGQIRNVELSLQRKDGESIICQASVALWRDDEGEAEAVQSFLRDVTEERRAQQALEESEEKFRALAEKSQIGIAMFQEGGVTYANPALAQIFGFSPDEIIGQSPEEFFHPDDRATVRKRINQRLKGGKKETRYEARVLRKDGDTRRVQISARKIIYQGQPTIVGTLRDVTEERRLQREVLRVQEEERRRLGQDLHDVVASQLTGVSLMMDTLAQQGTKVENLSERIQKIRDLVSESCEDIRQLSRGLTPAGLSESGLTPALEQLATNIEGGRLEADAFELDEELPGDVAAHLYWIAQEATTNARKYAEANEIVIRLQQEEDAIVLSVEDNGKGFDPQEVEEGGLGLRTMRYRAELLGADCMIDSNPGEGTLVRCHLPL